MKTILGISGRYLVLTSLLSCFVGMFPTASMASATCSKTFCCDDGTKSSTSCNNSPNGGKSDSSCSDSGYSADC